jgi:hypothetical protein
MTISKLWFLPLLLGAAVVGCQGESTLVPGDTTAPTLSSTVPANTATSVAFNANVTATFSKPMSAASLTTTTFSLKHGATTVAGTVTLVGAVATFAPTSPLAASTSYTATISVGAKDLAGNCLATPHTWSFATGVAPDVTPPTVASTVPGDAATMVAVNGSLTVTFSESMDPASVTSSTVTLAQGATPVTASVTSAGLVATMTPAANLAYSTTYTATISTGAKDLAGNALAAAHTWSFTTGVAPDTTPPTVASTDPADLAVGVAVNRSVVVTFSEGVDPATLTTAFTLAQGLTPVPATVTASGAVATLVPTSPLAAGTIYTATVSTGAKDLAGNALVAAHVWTFTTSAAAAVGPAPVPLGTATTFVILSKTGITNVPTSAVTGDVGTSPIDGAAIAGLTCPEVTGRIIVVDATGPAPCAINDPVFLTTVVGDMEIAYADAAGRVTPDFTEHGAGSIGGMVLVPGLYTWSTGLAIPTSITLQGGANDVWIFQVAIDLVVSDAVQVTLSGGAQAKNVFWQVGGQATLGSTVAFAGTILAKTQIAFTSGASLNGRALSQTAVTLQSNVLTIP